MTRPPGPSTATGQRSVRAPALPTRTAPPRPPSPRQDPSLHPGRTGRDRTAVRAAARARRRTEAGELRRPRAASRRRAVLVAAAVVVAVFVGGPLALAYGPFFTVRTIAVSGADGATPAAVRSALAGELGRPVALVSDADVAAALRAVPTVERFAVVRRPPATLEVVVVPRTPVAQTPVDDGWATVDAARVVLATSSTRDAALPVVDVPSGAAGRGAFAAAVAAIRALGGDPVVTGVRARSADDVVLTLDGGPRVLWGGADDGAAKAEALRAALQHAAAEATEVDVSSPGVVRTR